jgi:hypothetical protein
VSHRDSSHIWTWICAALQLASCAAAKQAGNLTLTPPVRKRNYAKEALSSYRNMCQAVNIASLEEVIKYLLKKASEKAEEAQNKASVCS